MNDVRLDLQQVPAPAELPLAAELGDDAPGRPIYARPEPDGHGDREPSARIKVGAMLTRRLLTSEATETPSGAAYGNPLRGRPEHSPSVPIGSALLARTDAADARGWAGLPRDPRGDRDLRRVDPPRRGKRRARGGAAAGRGEEKPGGGAAPRQSTNSRGDHAAAPGVAEWLANEQVERHGSKQAPVAGRTAAVAPQPRAPARWPTRRSWRSCSQLSRHAATGSRALLPS